jgi:hypothetical protein
VFDINHLCNLKGNGQLHKHALVLAQAWQQKPESLLALRMHNMMPDMMSKQGSQVKLAMLLGLSLISARAMYFSHEKSCEDSEHYRKSALELLKLSPLALDALQKKSASDCNSYQPFD